jgi:hypothetical protein
MIHHFGELCVIYWPHIIYEKLHKNLFSQYFIIIHEQLQSKINFHLITKNAMKNIVNVINYNTAILKFSFLMKSEKMIKSSLC